MIGSKLGLILALYIVKVCGESSVINDRYSVQWKKNKDEIFFMVTAKANGWIGLGFGPTKHMTGADLVIGGVKDGKGYLFVSDCLIIGLELLVDFF